MTKVFQRIVKARSHRGFYSFFAFVSDDNGMVLVDAGFLHQTFEVFTCWKPTVGLLSGNGLLCGQQAPAHQKGTRDMARYRFNLFTLDPGTARIDRRATLGALGEAVYISTHIQQGDFFDILLQPVNVNQWTRKCFRLYDTGCNEQAENNRRQTQSRLIHTGWQDPLPGFHLHFTH